MGQKGGLNKDGSSKCYKCGERLILTKDILFKNGKSFPLEIEMCQKCGETFTSLQEAERVKKELYPSFLDKLKNFFSNPNIHIESLLGKKIL